MAVTWRSWKVDLERTCRIDQLLLQVVGGVGVRVAAMYAGSDLEQWRSMLREETQSLRQQLREEMQEQLSGLEQPSLERLLSGNLRMPPELMRNRNRQAVWQCVMQLSWPQEKH